MDTKEHILQTALKLFAEHGFATTGIQEVTQTSGIAKPTLYYYFGSKEGLLEGILEKFFKPLLDNLTTVSNCPSDVPGSLYKFAETVFKFAAENKDFYRMLLSMGFDPPQSRTYLIIKPYLEKEYEIFESFFKAAQQFHGNMKDREKQYALSFIGLINTYISVQLNFDLDIDSSFVFRVVHQYMYGIFS